MVVIVIVIVINTFLMNWSGQEVVRVRGDICCAAVLTED